MAQKKIKIFKKVLDFGKMLDYNAPHRPKTGLLLNFSE